MKNFHHIVLVLLVLVACALGSCRGPRRIPRADMIDIYHDMFLLDQQIRSDVQYRRHADTMLVYERIFRDHGYNTDDYLHSVEYYLLDPERFAKMLSEVSDRLTREGNEVQRRIDLLEWRDGLMRIYGMEPDTTLPRRDILWSDTLFIVRDSSKALFFTHIRDTVPAPADTLMTAE